MASAPTFREPQSFESLGSGSLNADCSPPVVASSCFADTAAPVFPFNCDDLAEHDFGFGCSSSNASSILSSVPLGERHVFLCYKEPQSWPPLVEAAESDRLPRYLAAAIKGRKNQMSMKTRLTICEGRDFTDSSNGDIMIFPDMVRYRGLTHFDVDAFVDEVLVHNREWLSGRPERLLGTHIFVCAHGSHDARCGVSGPIVIGKFKEEISARGLGDHVFVRPCSHIGGHKYAGNLIIYSSNIAGEVLGQCYGYVTANDVPNLLNECFGEKYMADGHWRGCTGTLGVEPERATQNPLQDWNGTLPPSRNENGQAQEHINGHTNGKKLLSIDGVQRANEGRNRNGNEGQTSGRCRRFHSDSRWWQVSSWVWEREDTLAALAVLGAAASVAVAYHLYRIHARS